MANKVLVVDDSTSDLNNLVKIIKGQQCEVLTASDGELAIDLAKKEQPNIIFMDVNMVNMDGFQATRKILALPECKHIPIIFVTSKNQKADQMWAKMLGSKGFVSKPYTDQQIIDELKKFI